jgi:phage baseplate assembly protein W
MTDVPHFATPFRFEGGRAVEVEQDSDLEIQQSVETALRTPKGHFPEADHFGIPDQVFHSRSADRQVIERSLRESEPRVDYHTEELKRSDWLTSRVGIEIKGASNG